MKANYFFVSLAVFGVVFGANAAINNISQNNAAQYEAAYNTMTAEDMNNIAILENDIRLLDDEISKCEKKKKGWIAATVIGSAGVLSTGVAAIVQGVKIGEKKDTLRDKQQELNEIKDQTKALTIN